jgi:hypothetical protein
LSRDVADTPDRIGTKSGQGKLAILGQTFVSMRQCTAWIVDHDEARGCSSTDHGCGKRRVGINQYKRSQDGGTA